MKVTIENKKGLNKDLKVFIDKKTMNTHMDQRYEEIKGTVNLKGFRPGKVPKEILKRQFGKAVFGEVLDKVIKDSSTKALQENNIKPAGQPKLDLKTYGEDKDLEYVISVTELPKVEVKPIENIKFDEYSVKIDDTEADKRIKEIAKNQPNFKEAPKDTIAKEGDLVAFDYNATIDDKPFKGGEGKNTQLTLGKDLFLKGFDKQLIGVKVNDEKIMYVSTSDAEHPVWTGKQGLIWNTMFRAWHDWEGHIAKGRGFKLQGEIAAYNAHAKTVPRECIPILFTEVVGQICCFYQSGKRNCEQKAMMMPEFDYINVGNLTPEGESRFGFKLYCCCC